MDQRLEPFLTVCATMNYRKAAEQLHLTQPAVTKQIQALEALYGVRLFTYDSRKLRKTAQGETLEIYAISQRYQDEELRRALKRQEKTSLRIGATKSISSAGSICPSPSTFTRMSMPSAMAARYPVLIAPPTPRLC